MGKKPKLEKLKELGLNTYEAVIVASQHARWLNTQRLAQLERMEEDPTIDIDSRKITEVALQDVLDGRVKFKRPDSM
jgi:DNA-directed RNA polymerase subunit K/omega